MGHRVHLLLAARLLLRQREKRSRPAQSAISVALIFFNVGVLLGQMVFIASVVAVFAVARQVTHRLGVSRVARAWRVPTYAIGGVAMFWVMQRKTTY